MTTTAQRLEDLVAVSDPIQSVILSGAGTSRSEVSAESKDPYLTDRSHRRVREFSPWRSGSPRRLAARQKRGYECSLPTISHMPEKTRAKSRSAAAMCSKNYTRCCKGESGPPAVFHKSVLGRARLHRLRKKSVLHLILGGAALQRCGNCIVLNAALQVAEKLDFARDFGWRSASALR
jgi:hypothetical protein